MIVAHEPTRGLSVAPPDPLRYDGQTDEPLESTALLIAVIPSGARVLDVGCGTGSVSCLVRDRCRAQVVGLEPNVARAEEARRRGLQVIAAPFAPEVTIPLGKFDVVMFADVLEHLVDPVPALERAGNLLRPGGRVVASIPNVAHWTVRWDLLWGRFDYQPCGIMDATHLRWFTRKGIDRLFAGAGFSIESHRMSANVYLPEYGKRAPWRWMPHRVRSRLICCGVHCFPLLFGCQHVVAARVTHA
jgi:methionine biosynthesis protein MetW